MEVVETEAGKVKQESFSAGYLPCIAGALSLLPFLILTLYWHPVGTHGFDWASNWQGKFAAWSWWEEQVYWYTTTMGRFASTGLMSTAKYWYSLSGARILVLAIHIGFISSLVIAARQIAGRIQLSSAILLAGAITGLWICQLSNPYDTLYRYSGLLTYNCGLLAFLFLVVAGLQGRWYWAMALGVFAVGTNEITLVQTGMFTTAAFFYLKRSGKIPPSFYWFTFWVAVAAIFEVVAPGNWVRAALPESGEKALLSSLGLTLGSSVYMWVGWLSSTPIIPLIILGRCYSPQFKLDRVYRVWIGVVIIAWLPLSLFPVIFMTGGNSLPEGITDLQIIPVSLLLLAFFATGQKWMLSVPVQWALATYCSLSFLLQGLSIDRGREAFYPSPLARIELSSRAGNAWKQLADGSAYRYDKLIMTHYAAAKTCQTETCYVGEITDQEACYLYDATYDRRDSGENSVGYLTGNPGVVIRYPLHEPETR